MIPEKKPSTQNRPIFAGVRFSASRKTRFQRGIVGPTRGRTRTRTRMRAHARDIDLGLLRAIFIVSHAILTPVCGRVEIGVVPMGSSSKN